MGNETASARRCPAPPGPARRWGAVPKSLGGLCRLCWVSPDMGQGCRMGAAASLGLGHPGEVGALIPRTFVPDQVVSQNDEEAEQEEDDDGHHSADDRMVRAGGRRHRAGVCPGGREGESRERERERGGGAAVPAVRHRLRLAPRIARGSGQAGLHPARPRCCGGKEGAGAEPGGKQRPRVPGSPGGVSTAVGNPRPVCALVLRDCSAVTVPEGWEGTEPRS